MKRIARFLSSLRFSFFLILLLLGVIVQRAILAQRAFLSPDHEKVPMLARGFDRFGLNSLELLNTIFWVVLSVFGISLFFTVKRMIRQGRARRAAFSRFRDVDSIREMRRHMVIALPVSPSPETIKTFFQRRGFRVSASDGADAGLLLAVRRDLGRWGVLLFHLTFFLFFLGGTASFLTRFTGYFELAPGETFTETYDGYIQKTPRPVFFGPEHVFTMTLEEIRLSYWKPGEVRQRAAIVRLTDDDNTVLPVKNISVNNPIRVGDRKIYQAGRHGFIASITVTDETGTRAEGVIRFLLGRKDAAELLTWVRLPGTRLDLKLELFTDMVRRIEGLEDYYSSPFTGSLIKVTSQEAGREPVFRGVLFGGGDLSFEGLTLHFDSLKPFTSFTVTRDYGVVIIFAGFVLLLLSLCITYFWVPERFWIALVDDGRKVYVGGSRERYKESFGERFALLADELRKNLAS
ncbi:MAG: hypothetical protein Kow0089_12690 [Desulfobulbaceae bacterium]